MSCIQAYEGIKPAIIATYCGPFSSVFFYNKQLYILMWHPRFLINVINANGRINQVKPADTGQT
jgi:hypothetical protein